MTGAALPAGLTWRSDGRKSHVFGEGNMHSLCARRWLVDTVEDEDQSLADQPLEGDCKVCWKRARKKVK